MLETQTSGPRCIAADVFSTFAAGIARKQRPPTAGRHRQRKRRFVCISPIPRVSLRPLRIASAVVALSMLCGALAGAQPSASSGVTQPVTATAADPTAVITAASSDASGFADVPMDNFAYDAIKQLQAAGYIKGYPDGTFKGQRPMTRYEAAYLVSQAVNGMKDAIASGRQIARADELALQKLVAALGDQVKDVQARTAALEAKTAAVEAKNADLQRQQTATKAEADATQYLLNRQRVGIDFTFRPGFYSQTVGVAAGAGTAEPAGVAPGQQIPPFRGQSTIAPGSNYGTNYAAWQGNALPVGTVAHGVDFLLARFSIGGAVTPTVFYGVRIKASVKLENALGATTASPAYCASTGGVNTTGAGCTAGNVAGAASNIADALDLAYVGYQKGGVYAQAGRFVPPAEGYYNNNPMILGGQAYTGVTLGYADPQRLFQAGVAYGIPGLTSTSQALANGGPAVSNTCSAVIGLNVGQYGNYGVNPGCNTTQAEYTAEASYYIKRTRTAFGGVFDNFIGLPLSSFDERATLCTNSNTLIAGVTGIPAVDPRACAAVGSAPVAGVAPGAYITEQTTAPVGSFFISQFFGRTVNPQWNFVGEFGRRFGHDPYTGQLWTSPNALQLTITYASKGNIYGGSPVPFIGGIGSANSNVAQAFFYQYGLHSVGGIEGGYAASTVATNNLGITNPNGTRTYGVQLTHWFSDYFRVGLIGLNVSNSPNTSIPVGALTTCQGCLLTNLHMNQLILDTTMAVR